MEKQELYELMDRFAQSPLQMMKLRDGGFSVELRKPEPACCSAQAPAAQPGNVPADPPAAETAPEGELVRAPLVGTYYAASAPGAAPFVQAGDRVEKGATLCLIEAMKTMSEVPAPCDLIVEQILVSDGELVGFDAPLLRYRHV